MGGGAEGQAGPAGCTLELLDQHRWDTRQQLALAIFDWIEGWYNPRRRHSYCEMLSPADYETAHALGDLDQAA